MATIQENPENDKILSLVLADKVRQARYSKSTEKVCDDLGIDFISNNPLGTGFSGLFPPQRSIIEVSKPREAESPNVLNRGAGDVLY